MVEDSGRYVSAFPGVSVQAQEKKKTFKPLIQSSWNERINLTKYKKSYPLRSFAQTLRTADFLFTEVGCAGTGETKQNKHNKFNPLSHSLYPILFCFCLGKQIL